MKTTGLTLIGCVLLLISVGPVFAETGMSSQVRQISSMRQDALRAPSLNDVSRHAPFPSVAALAIEENAQSGMLNSLLEPAGAHSYDPSGRRDPFSPVLQQLGLGPIDPTLPPLQRVGLTEMNLIAVVWGAYGYTAMVHGP